MNSAQIEALAFDLDGTLIDSRHDLAEAANRLRADFGLAELPLAEVVRMVGRGARDLVREVVGDACDEAQLDGALSTFLAHYDAVATDRTLPYPGISALLCEQAGRRRLALATNKPERATRRILEHFGWDELFEVVIGGDTLPVRKPDAGVLRSIAARLGLAADRVLMVGDSRVDAAAARAAGSPFVFVEWGFASADESRELADEWRARDSASLRSFLSR